jgi:HTH-type transcriptional regulator/antitoxin MqsA
VYRYKGESLTIAQTGAWCTVCGEGILDHQDVRVAEKRLAVWRAKVNQQIAAMIKQTRQNLGLSQEEMAALAGGGKKAFAKYETGAVVPSEAMIHLMRLLGTHPDLLQELRVKKKTA